MRRYEDREVTVYREVEVEARCDGCGALERDAGLGLTPVAIEVNLGNCFGRRDEYDYCNDCLIERASLLVAAGSKSDLLRGDDADP